MKVAYICPTRGKPEYVKDFLMETVANCRLPDTRFVIGYDDDETDLYADLFPHPRLVESVAPREDSLGAKYNRCAAAIDADVYVMGVDDLAIKLVGWDYTVAQLAGLFTDSVGVITFGDQWQEPSLPAFQCATKRFVELNGFFMAPHFPYWWHDTWNLEMAELIGRRLHFPCDIRYPDKSPPYQRRDLAFWAEFFDDTRPLRCETADRILAQCDNAPWLDWALLAQRDTIMDIGQRRNSTLRDPAVAKGFEGGDLVDPHPERLIRLKAAAMALLSENTKAAA